MNNQQLDLNTIFSSMMTLVIVVMMMKMMMKVVEAPKEKPVRMLGEGEAPPGYERLYVHHSSPRRTGEPKSEAERAKEHLERYGEEGPPERGRGLEGQHSIHSEPPFSWEATDWVVGKKYTIPDSYPSKEEALQAAESFIETELKVSHLPSGKYGYLIEVYDRAGYLQAEPESYSPSWAEQGERSGEEHSIHGPERERLVREFGTWAVGRAESVCPEDDVACVERESARLLEAHRGAYVTPSTYYWSIKAVKTGEIAESGKPYSSTGMAVRGAKAYIKGQLKGEWWPSEGTYITRIYSSPPSDRETFTEEGMIQEVTVKGTEV